MNSSPSVLVVDDEKNIRMTMVHALESNGFHVESAMSGEEAVLMLRASPFDLMFLDLKMPGMGGMAVLRETRKSWPTVRVVIITAHGTVDNAVDAMKLGAADFIQKPFTAGEIRQMAKDVLAPPPKESHTAGYEQCLDEARRSIEAKELTTAMAYIRRAVGLDPSRPEAFNLLGATVHLSGERYKAQDYFRAALALDPTYEPAQHNLEASAAGGVRGFSMGLVLGESDRSE